MTRLRATPPARPGFTLLTGATGLLGRYLLRDLLRAREPVAVLVRPVGGVSPEARVASIVDMWAAADAAPLERPVVLTGDISLPAVGLDEASRSWIAEHCRRVVHNAAVIRFQGRSRKREPWRSNWRGTEEVIRLCRELDQQDLHYVSTAYVCGDRKGVIDEDELDRGQGFRNDYEESKFLAERCVHAATDIAHRTVYRPGVIAGDARTGYTSTLHGFYVYLRALSMVIPRLRPDSEGTVRIPYRPRVPLTEPRNIVPVDWVSAAMVRLLGRSDARGRTYHMTPRSPITPREVIDATGRYYGVRRVELCQPRERIGALHHVALAARVLRRYESYSGAEPEFRTDNLDRFVPDVPCPTIDEAMVGRYLAFAERTEWGRCDMPAPAR